MKLKTQWRIASVLFFLMVMVYVKLKADIYTIGKIIGFAFVISTPIGILLWKYKSKLNSKIFKGFAALSIPVGLFFWRWLHSRSFVGEYICAFVLAFLIMMLAFLFNEQDLKNIQ